MSRLRLFPLAALLGKIHIVSYPTGHLMDLLPFHAAFFLFVT